MCGSCEEFAPKWNELAKSVKGQIETAKVDIDDSQGMQLAEEIGVLEQGIPNVRIFHDLGTTGITLLDGSVTDFPSSSALKRQALNHLKGHTKSSDGGYLKSGHDEL